ncbi:MAG: (2Fe-2S)-binding protein [Flammeovirgaceae bacterium]|nr:(2Fe-2S)-binding protein [Flammeovirgaceae bacterium]MDW8288098.1 2Fe-2S iron-sulfur cluster-binding protein [Flammeovirgaceae bacterium]
MEKKITLIIKNLHHRRILLRNGCTLLDVIHENHIDWMHSCGKKGRCTTCKAIVHEGMELLSPPTIHEKQMLHLKKLHPNERLTCQATGIENAHGEILVSVPKIYQLPHVVYSNELTYFSEKNCKKL